jgi:hypothetical protein
MPFNTVVWITERQEELPVEFVSSHRLLRVIAVPHADADQRQAAAVHAIKMIAQERGIAHADERLAAAAANLASAASGMANAELISIARTALDRGLPPEPGSTASASPTTPGPPRRCGSASGARRRT